MKIVLHPASDKQYQQFTAALPHALLIVGEKGLGASTVAETLAHTHTKHVHAVVPEKDDKPNPDGSISVDRIRELYATSRTRTTMKRVIHIVDAHKMTVQSQNAFLKLLEEPPENTHFILSTHTIQPLLPTILSRVQTLELRHITDTQSKELLEDLKVTDTKVHAQAMFIAAGRPAELSRLTQEPAALTAFASIIGDARTLLQGELYDKLLVVNTYKDSRERSIDLVDTVLKLLRMTLMKAPTNTQLLERMNECLSATDRLKHNGNVRLVLTRLVI